MTDSSSATTRTTKLWPTIVALLLVLVSAVGLYGWQQGMIRLPDRVPPTDLATPASDPSHALPDSMRETLLRQEERIAELSDRIDQLTATPSISAEDVRHLTSRIEAAERALAAMSSEQSAAVQALLAFEDMRRAALKGAPFTNEWQTFEATASGYEAAWRAATPLKKSAKDGIPTLVALKQELDKAIRKSAHGNPQQDDTFLQQVGHNLSSLVIIRKVGSDHAGDDDASHIARAEAALRKQDIARATREIVATTTPRRSAFAKFLQLAEEYQQASAALDEVGVQLRRALTAPHQGNDS